MERACTFLQEQRLNPRDTHATNPYDFLCHTRDGERLYVEVKGTQDDGRT
jgi:DNA-binding sugar fermentation-stimulating protein